MRSVVNIPHRIDKWLWQRGLGHPVVMPIVRNELLIAALLLCGGVLFFLFTSWIFWFGVGFSILALTFLSLARFFLRIDMSIYTAALLFSVLLRWSGRLLLTVCLLYVALVLCAAPAMAVLGGLVCASILALVTFAVTAKRH